MPGSGLVKILIGVFGPPVTTAICWLLSRRLPGVKREKMRPMTAPQAWLLLITAYIMFAAILWGDDLIALIPRRHLDPSTEMVQ